MKYVHIVQFHSRKGGGVGSVITDLCEELAKTSNDVYVISLFQNPEIDFESEKLWGKEHNIHIDIAQKNKESIIGVLLNIRSIIRDLCKNDDVCMFLHLKWGVLAGIIGSLGMKRVRRIEVYHSGYMNYKLQAKMSKHYLNHYIAVSKEAKNQLVSCFGIDASKITVIYNGVDIREIQKIVSVNHLKPTNNEMRFISVGRLTFEKGFLDSISAYSNMKRKEKLSNSLYIMVGQGAQMEEARRIAGEHVIFTGMIPRKNVFQELANSDVVILPSLWEGNSILLLETLAIGKPVVVSDIPSFREVLRFEPLLEDEEYRKEPFGIVFRKSDSESCAKALEEIYMTDKNERFRMGKYVESISADFSIQMQATKYLELAEQQI